MKKLALIILMSVAVCGMACAQELAPDWRKTFKRHEFSLGIGDPVMANLSRTTSFRENNSYSGASSWLIIPAHTEVYTTMPFTLGYRFRLLKWLWLGGDISYCGFRGTSRDLYTGDVVTTYREKMLCIMPAIRFSYLNREHVMLYSGFAQGLKFDRTKVYDASTFDVRLPFQVTLIGVSAGSQSWFGFAELGVGNEGIIKAGFGYRFNATPKL